MAIVGSTALSTAKAFDTTTRVCSSDLAIIIFVMVPKTGWISAVVVATKF